MAAEDITISITMVITISITCATTITSDIITHMATKATVVGMAAITFMALTRDFQAWAILRLIQGMAFQLAVK